MRAVVTPPMHDDRLDDALRQACTRHADRIALDGEECRLTYRELSDAADALAAQLRDGDVLQSSNRLCWIPCRVDDRSGRSTGSPQHAR